MSGDTSEELPPNMSRRAKLDCKCTACGCKAPGELHAASLGPYGAEWLSPPKGWFVLLGVREPFMRCPDCLAAPPPERESGTRPIARVQLKRVARN